MKLNAPHITLLSLLFFAMVALCGSCSSHEETPERDYVSELRSVDKLILSEMSVTKMGTIDDLRPEDSRNMGETLRAWLNTLKIGSRKGAWSYSTYMRAYIDMERITDDDIRVDKDHNRLTVRMPEIEVEITGRDGNFREEHYRVSGLRSNIGAAERARLKEEMNKLLRKEVEERPEFRNRLIETAREKGTEYFKAFGEASGMDIDLIWQN